MSFHGHKNKRKNTLLGFSLIELMVALSIFSIVMTISVGTLLVLIDANAKAQALSSAMTNLSFAIDSMTRNIRTGREYYCRNWNKLETGNLLRTGTKECEQNEKTGIVFTPGFGNATRMAYRLNGGALEQRTDVGGVAGTWVPITSRVGPAAITINALDFNVRGVHDTSDLDYEQPIISILIQGAVSNGLETPTTFKIQSNVTQRVLDY